MSAEEQVPYPHLWDLYMAVIAIASAVVVLVDESPWPAKIGAAGAIAAMAVVHAVFGRRLVRADKQSGRLLVVLLVLFAVAVTLVPESNWLLFGLIPLIFQLVGLRAAAIGVVLANAVLSVSDLILRPASVRTDLVISVISCAAGVWLGFWIVRIIEQSQERHRLIMELESSRAEVARLSREAGVTAERSRLAAEIHDTLAQGFTSIITLLQAADPELRNDKIALAVRTARENLAESRSLVAALSPSPLASGSLPSSVRRQVARFGEESGVQAGLRVTGDQRELPTAAEVVLLRAAQEALTNVRRHASAHEVTVLIAYGSSAVRLVVKDDGCGFGPEAADGYGLPGMRARAEQVSGTVTVRSEPGRGTTVEVEVPV